MFRAFRYKNRKIKYINLYLYDETTIGKINTWENSEQAYFGKTAYVRDWNDPNSSSGEDTYGPKWTLQTLVSDIPEHHAGVTLYIAPESKISRDVLRNDAYTITYDKAKSDYRVLPAIARHPDKQKCQILFVVKDQLHLCNVERTVGNMINDSNGYNSVAATATEVETVLSYLENTYAVNRVDMMYRKDNPLYKMNAWFISVCADTEYYLTRNCRLSEKFCFDTDVPLHGTTKITPENLLLWSKYQDKNLLEKSLLNSDWKKYPATVCIFLAKEKSNMAHVFSPAGKVMMKAIHFDLMDRYYGSLGGQVIQPDDWNMLQDYIMLKFGLPDKRGFVQDLGPYEDFIKHRNAVAQLRIAYPMTFENIDDMLEGINGE